MHLCILLNSIILCSYWFLDVPSEPSDDIRVYHPTSGSSALTDFLAQVKECNDRPVYIGFGSMEELGFFSSIDCVELLCILNEGMDDLFINIVIILAPVRCKAFFRILLITTNSGARWLSLLTVNECITALS